ncbi:hypothetical protein ACWFR5_16970 [Streptomyces sp. NPDC055092]
MASSDDPVTPCAATAVDALREALSQADIVIPSLGVDDAWPHLDLVELGRIRPAVAIRLADAIRRGGREREE